MLVTSGHATVALHTASDVRASNPSLVNGEVHAREPAALFTTRAVTRRNPPAARRENNLIEPAMTISIFRCGVRNVHRLAE
jgi:hypothetical protein